MFFPEGERLKGLKGFAVLKLKNTLSSVVGSEATSNHSHCADGRWPRTTTPASSKELHRGRRTDFIKKVNSQIFPSSYFPLESLFLQNELQLF